VRIIFFGTPEFAVLPFKSLLNSEYRVLAAITQPDRKSGRGGNVTPSPVKVTARESGIEVFQPERIKDHDFISVVMSLKPDAIAVVAYGQILPAGIINLPEYGCINVHASLLPRYRGAAPINWAIIRGEKYTGITTMLMDEGMDTGPVLIRKETEILPDDSAGSLSQRLSEIGAELLLQTLQGVKLGSLVPSPQSGEPTYAPLLKKADGLIPWTRSAGDLSFFIRGMNPWPGAYTYTGGERIKILKAVPLDGDAEPGVVAKVSTNELYVGTGKGLLSVRELQPPGKQAMEVRAYLMGRRVKQGIRFHD
jgi:methionyl-tRNA formyltransferase